MIKAIIFDLNGVFIHSPKLSDRFLADFGVPAEVFLPKLNEIMDRVRRPGAEPSFEYWKPVLKDWNVLMNEDEFWNYWFEAETPSIDMIALAKSLKDRGLEIITLSNNFKERAEYYGNYPWMLEVVDKAYFSWQTGLVKPDVEAWKLVLNDFSLQGSECLYFDDQEKNLKIAKSLGIQAFAYVSVDDTKREIEALIP